MIDCDFHSRVPKVEDIQDIVQLVLIENNLSSVAQRYIVHRMERRIFRESNALKEPILTTNHKEILKCVHVVTVKNHANYITSEPLRKEWTELEQMGYLLTRNNVYGRLDISLNPNQNIQFNHSQPERAISS